MALRVCIYKNRPRLRAEPICILNLQLHKSGSFPYAVKFVRGAKQAYNKAQQKNRYDYYGYAYYGYNLCKGSKNGHQQADVHKYAYEIEGVRGA